MANTIPEKVTEILAEKRVDEEKIRLLEELRTDLRAEQRAATESPMVTSDGYEEDLQLIDVALEKLHATKVAEADEKDAATL